MKLNINNLNAALTARRAKNMLEYKMKIDGELVSGIISCS